MSRLCLYWCRSIRHDLLQYSILGNQRRTNKSSYPNVSSCLLQFNIRKYLQAVLRQNVAFFDRLGAGEVTNRLSNDVELIRAGISDKVRLKLRG